MDRAAHFGGQVANNQTYIALVHTHKDTTSQKIILMPQATLTMAMSAKDLTFKPPSKVI